MSSFRIAVIAGDGIGKEVIPAGIAAIEKATRGSGVSVSFSELPWSCEYYLQHGRMMDEDGYERMAAFDALYMGALGAPGVSDAASAGLILGIRQKFDQYVNLRPMRLLPGLSSPLANRGAGGHRHGLRARELGGRVLRRRRPDPSRHAARGRAAGRRLHAARHRADPALRLRGRREAAAEDARQRDQVERAARIRWCCGTRSPRSCGRTIPAVEYRKYHVDALAARMITHPQTLDVMVTSNLFGDILTDIGSAISGSLGIAPGANINPTRQHPSMFEPIHGSAPDIAGKGIANPIGAIWAGALMLEHLGHRDLHDKILGAIERVVATGKVRTPDLGGTAKTKDVADAIVGEI